MANWKKIVFGELSWKRLAKSIISVYTIIMVVAVAFGDHFIFVPPEPSYSEKSPNISTLPLTHSEVTIAVLYLPAKKEMPTLLWSHGNAEDLGYARPLLDAFHSKGFGILAYDYPGYGISTGESSDLSVYDSIDSVFHYALNHLKLPQNKIIAVGQSVGSGPACYLAENKDLAGLALITPLTSVYRVAFKYPIFPRDRFPNIKRMPQISEPLMIIHGDQDEVIPQTHGKALAQAYVGTPIFYDLSGKGHNDIAGTTYQEIDSYIQLFVDFSKDL
ncbi:alpha/beta hydrolase [Rubritalea spongiae]|uniref:Alpha/beta hydrolase n=1 Tax=Rubritalea spongiae TaxID=430797 RepID=A0ABW5E229_9BACT